MPNPKLHHYCEVAKQLAIQAGAEILKYYRDPNLSIHQKMDNSPLTAADIAAHQVIQQGLQAAFPNIPILSEEGVQIPYKTRQQWQTYWLIDPLDGTREFLKGNGEFTVNIALIQQNIPIVGVIYAPVPQQLYWATANSLAYQQLHHEFKILHVKPATLDCLRLAISRSHHQPGISLFTATLKNCEIVHMGSSLKTCLVAAGEADLYPCFGPTAEWDTAAAQCILTAAGGKIIDVSGKELRYNTGISLLNPWFLAIGDLTTDWLGLIPNELEISVEE